LGKALALGASDNRPVIKSGLKVTGLAIKRKPCALQTPLGSLDITPFVMSPCLLAEMFSLFLSARPEACPSAPRGSPGAIEIKNLELQVLKPFPLIALSS
jgi:hypothetical protein